MLLDVILKVIVFTFPTHWITVAWNAKGWGRWWQGGLGCHLIILVAVTCNEQTPDGGQKVKSKYPMKLILLCSYWGTKAKELTSVLQSKGTYLSCYIILLFMLNKLVVMLHKQSHIRQVEKVVTIRKGIIRCIMTRYPTLLLPTTNKGWRSAFLWLVEKWCWVQRAINITKTIVWQQVVWFTVFTFM